MTEMNLHAIAGFCSEEALWKMLKDMTSALLDQPDGERAVLMPEKVIVDGERFLLSKEGTQHPAAEFYPPEGIKDSGDAGIVWSLGALACYASSGHYVFGGRGGVYQQSNPKTELPTLRREHSALTAVIRQCLCYSPSQRISLRALHAAAVAGCQQSEQRARVLLATEKRDGCGCPDVEDDGWPERMT
jgi:hypothetical protein